MMKKITGIVLCLAILLSMGCAYAAPKAETQHTYAEPSADVKLAFHLYETFKWSIPNDDTNMDQYNRTDFGNLKAWEVFVGNGTLTMYVSSQNGFELKCTSTADAYKNLSLSYDLYSASEGGTAINNGTVKEYGESKTKLYPVFTVTTAEKEKSKTMYYDIIDVSPFNGLSYDDYLTFYALVDSGN